MRQKKRQQFGQEKMQSQIELHFPEDSIKIKAKAIDISQGGIGLYTAKRIPVGRKVTVCIGFLDDHAATQFESVGGIVKWCRTHGLGFTAGIEFDPLDPRLHPKLAALLQQGTPLLHHAPELNAEDGLEE